MKKLLILVAAITFAAGALAHGEPIIDGVYNAGEYANSIVPTYDVIQGLELMYDDYSGGVLAWEVATTTSSFTLRGEAVDVAPGDLYISFMLPQYLVDNAYGDQAAASGWNNHTFQHLWTSDNVAMALELSDGSGTVFDANIDYLSRVGHPQDPDGYWSLGLDGDGSLNVGLAEHLKAWNTSLDYNLNALAEDWHDYTVNSPDPSDPIYGDWVFDVTYELLISADAFSSEDINLQVTYAHLSPVKTGAVSVIPEPVTVALLGSVSLGAAFAARRKKS